MKLLIDIYSDYGSIIAASSELEVSGLSANNVLDQVPTAWGTSVSTTHTIRGSLGFVDSMDYTCPVDSFVIVPIKLPVGTSVTLNLYSTYPSSPVFTYNLTTTVENEEIKVLGFDIQLATQWELVFTLPSPTYIVISRVLIAQGWVPTYGVTGVVDISKVGYFKGERYRNGGTFIAPSANYTTQKLEFSELTRETAYSLLDALSRYGSGATIVVNDLAGDSSLTVSSIYGRVKEWGIPKKSISQAYSLSLNIEEILQ